MKIGQWLRITGYAEDFGAPLTRGDPPWWARVEELRDEGTSKALCAVDHTFLPDWLDKTTFSADYALVDGKDKFTVHDHPPDDVWAEFVRIQLTKGDHP